MIGDPELKVAKLYDMLPADAGNTSEGRTAATNATVRTVFVVGPDKKIKLMLSYPMSTGRNFDEVLRVLDSIQLTAKHQVSTPVNWKQGEDVIISGSVSDERPSRSIPAAGRRRGPTCGSFPSRSRRSASGGSQSDLQTVLSAVSGARFLRDWRRGDRHGGRRRSATRHRISTLAFAAEHSLTIKHVSLRICTPILSPDISNCATAWAPPSIWVRLPRRRTRSRRCTTATSSNSAVCG